MSANIKLDRKSENILIDERNYAPTIKVLEKAEKKGYHQVLWLYKRNITEIGASNFFFVSKDQEGKNELVTAPLDGVVLPGVVRDSILVFYCTY